jgi:hypothetical protein
MYSPNRTELAGSSFVLKEMDVFSVFVVCDIERAVRRELEP